MTLTWLTDKLLAAGFKPTQQPLTLPIVIHGVPGCGKSTLIKSCLGDPDVIARTCGAPYGDSLESEGVATANPEERLPARHRILDEYQLGNQELAAKFTILVGDPYQGSFRLRPHFTKPLSHRVPRAVCTWLGTLGFQIQSDQPGTLTLCHPFKLPPDHPALRKKLIHLGPASKALLTSHGLPSVCPSSVQGLEFQEATVVAHSSELHDRVALYIALTRSSHQLTLLSDSFDELFTAA